MFWNKLEGKLVNLLSFKNLQKNTVTCGAAKCAPRTINIDKTMLLLVKMYMHADVHAGHVGHLGKKGGRKCREFIVSKVSDEK